MTKIARPCMALQKFRPQKKPTLPQKKILISILHACTYLLGPMLKGILMLIDITLHFYIGL